MDHIDRHSFTSFVYSLAPSLRISLSEVDFFELAEHGVEDPNPCFTPPQWRRTVND